jgi:hypothetical protein
MLIHVNHDDGNTYTADVPDDAEYVVIFTDKAAARFLNNDTRRWLVSCVIMRPSG